MSDKQISNEPGKESKVRKRRPRTASNERNYICSCGKSYLSYPALYTHIKNKHQGKPPGPIKIPKADKALKGRKFIFNVEDEQDPDNHMMNKPSSYYIDQFVNFFNGFEMFSQPYDPKQVIEKLPPETSFSFISALKDWQNGKVEEIELKNGALNTNVERVFAKFILQLSPKVDKHILAQVLILLHIWRKTFKKLNIQSSPIKQYNSNESCQNILQIVNTLMETSFQEEIPKYSSILEEHYLLDESKPKLMNKCICKFVYLFSKWLFAERYVNTVLGINKFSDIIEDNVQ